MSTAPGRDTEVARHVAEIEDQGWTVLPGAHDAAWVARAQAAIPAMQERRAVGSADRPWMVDELLELEPALTLEAITRERVLAVAEGLIGPHVQVESTTVATVPPCLHEPQLLTGWHRDLFALFPDGAYRRPWLFNAMAYLQDLDDAVGPLWVVPGSHRLPVTVDEGAKQAMRVDAVALRPRAGDVVVFHNALLHSGSHNRSDGPRRFFCVTYNHCWLKHRANYAGPVCQRIIREARARGDRRLLRLLGADDQALMRALHDHVLAPEATTWARWMAEDRAAARP